MGHAAPKVAIGSYQESPLPHKTRVARITLREVLCHLLVMVTALGAVSGCGSQRSTAGKLTTTLQTERDTLVKTCGDLEDLVINLRREIGLSVEDFEELVDAPAPAEPPLKELHFLHGSWLDSVIELEKVKVQIAELEAREPEGTVSPPEVYWRKQIMDTVRNREVEPFKWRDAQLKLQSLKREIARVNNDVQERHIDVLPGESQIDELVREVRKALAERDAEDRDYYEAYGRIDGPVPKELKNLIGDRRRRHEPGHQREVKGPGAARLPKGELLKLLGQPEELAIVEWTRFGGELAHIPEGSWFVGSPSDETGRGNDEFKHEVKITRPFLLGVHPVTVQQALEWLNDETTEIDPSWIDIQCPCAPIRRAGAKFEAKDSVSVDHPMVHITFYGAQAYCAWLTVKEHVQYRLPSEAEWEYAARAWTTTSFFFAKEDEELDQFIWCRRNSGGKTRPVGSKNTNLLGLKDMLGNVWEWTGDWFDVQYYTRGPYPHVDPKGPERGGAKVVRGGSCSESPSECRCANRRFVRPDQSHCHLGFRIVRVCEKDIGDSTQP